MVSTNNIDMSKDYKAFMAHIPKKEWKNVVSHLVRKFPDRKYLVAGECKPYEHMHFLIEMTDIEYRNYANSVFRQKYKLRGRAQKDKARQYGKLKQINDLERLQAYMIKENLDYNNNIFTNLDKDKLKRLKDTISHSKIYEYPYKIFINYLKSNDLEQLTIYKLAEIWLKETKSRLPTRDSLLYYAYTAGKLREEDYIYNKYGQDALNSLNV